jgi:hypothetical protein
MESKGHPSDPSKEQRPAGSTPDGWQAKRPKQGGQLSYARATREGVRVGDVCKNYPESQISKENFVAGQSASSWMSSLKRGSPPSCLIRTGLNGSYYSLPQ